MGENVEMLENHSHFLAVKVNIDFFACNIGSLEDNASGIGSFKHIEAAKEGGFSAAGRSDYGDNLLGSNVFVNTFKNLEVAEAFIKINCLDHLLLSLLS